MSDAKYISNTITKVNNFKDLLALKFKNICDMMDKIDVLNKVKAILDYEDILEAIASFYYYNASYDACENYSDIESFMEALKESEMEELSSKYSKDGKTFEIGCLSYGDFDYRTALGWTFTAFDSKVLKVVDDYVNAVNPKMFEKTTETADLTEFDAFALHMFYKDAYADMCSKFEAIFERAETVKSSIEFYLINAEKYNMKDKTKLAVIKAIKDNDVISSLNEIIALKEV